MCLHNEAEAKEVEQDLRNSKNATYRQHAVLIMRTATGAFAAAWVANAANTQLLANTLRDVKNWHEGEDLRPDLTHINAVRASLRLQPVNSEGLPVAVGTAHRGYGYETTKSEAPELRRLKRNIRSYMRRQQRDALSA